MLARSCWLALAVNFAMGWPAPVVARRGVDPPQITPNPHSTTLPSRARSFQPTHAEAAGKADLVVKDASRELKRTHVSAAIGAPHAKGTNLLWCATFQIAWDQFGTIGGPLRLQGDPAVAVELSAYPFPRGALDDGSFVAMIGQGPGVIDRIRSELRRTFKGAASPSVLPPASQIAEDDLVAYAYLFKNLAFETAFTRAPRGMVFGATDAPRPKFFRAFGVFHDTEDRQKVASQMTVWEYAAADNFVIELHAVDRNDRLIIARLTPGGTLKATADVAMARVAGAAPRPGLRQDDVVSIPVLNFDITRSYDELTNIPVTTPDSPARSLRSAAQNIRFRLDEKGAVLKSDASLVAPTSAPAGARPEPRLFVCDGPFLVLMQRRGAAVPYFAAWIDNSELLVGQK